MDDKQLARLALTYATDMAHADAEAASNLRRMADRLEALSKESRFHAADANRRNESWQDSEDDYIRASRENRALRAALGEIVENAEPSPTHANWALVPRYLIGDARKTLNGQGG